MSEKIVKTGSLFCPKAHKQFVAVFCMVLLLLSVCGHKGFPAITLALLDRSSEFLMQKTWPPHAILVSEWPIYKK
jgi:hypothetical protein